MPNEPTDTERLDWLEKHKPLVSWIKNGTECRLTTPFMTFFQPTLRAGVDEGIQKLEKHEAEIEGALKEQE